MPRKVKCEEIVAVPAAATAKKGRTVAQERLAERTARAKEIRKANPKLSWHVAIKQSWAELKK